jgi:sigma-54 dependent transcriptional regulator, flagellar regulatory protein
MPQEYKVAIIDDDRMSSHNWSILLKFIGEDPLMLTAENWQQTISQLESDNKVFVVIIGNVMESRFNENALLELIQAIHEWDSNVSFLLKPSGNSLQGLDVSIQSLILDLPEQTDYQSLLKALNQARNTLGLDKPELKSNLISETGTAMFRSLVGQSELMQETRELMHKVADNKVNVLVLGESGTGKEIMARNIHYHSGRGDKPFIAANCTALAEELFGHEAGFNGAVDARPGLFEKADGGTLFLDEIGDMSLETQAKVMRFLDGQNFERLGGSNTIQTDVRVVAASNKNLEEKIKSGGFREDLYYRLSVVPVEVPALRNHSEDIPELISELISRLEHQSHNSVRFNSSAMVSLQRHRWPGNVRELANLVERLSIIQANEVVGVNDLPLEYQYVAEAEIAQLEESDESVVEEEEHEELRRQDVEIYAPQALQTLTAKNLKEYLTNFDKQLIMVALDDSAGMLNFAAERLSIDEQELKEKMQVHGLKH